MCIRNICFTRSKIIDVPIMNTLAQELSAQATVEDG